MMVFLFKMLLISMIAKDTLLIKNGKIKLDGIEDTIWNSADSVIITKMSTPYYGEQSKHPAVCKALQDVHNLYFLIKVDYESNKPNISLTGPRDWYSVLIDPFLSKVEAYMFSTSLSQERFDGMVLNDGQGFSSSWDGVWEAKSKLVHKNKRYTAIAEFKIPFKTLKYNKSNSLWGVNFQCDFDETNEKSWWKLPPKNEDTKVSDFGILKEVKPSPQGLGLEIYPVFLTRAEYSLPLNINRLKFKTGLDLKFQKGALSLSTTFFPDYAEIESDPFMLTLGRSELYFQEKRPFFLEGQEVFNTTGIRYMPAQLLYSRRIGRKVSQITDEVPIIFGAKAIEKGKRVEIGALSVLTGTLNTFQDTIGTSIWNALRIKKRVFKNSDIGITGVIKKEMGIDSMFYAMSLDGMLRKNSDALSYQVVLNKSDSGTFGILLQSGGMCYYKKHYILGFYGGYANERFNISPTGYSGFFPGDKIGSFSMGYYRLGKSGSALRRLETDLFFNLVKYRQDPGISHSVAINTSLQFQKPFLSGFYSFLSIGKDYTQDTMQKPYTSKGMSFEYWSRIKSFSFFVHFNHTYGWNYRRMYKAKYNSLSLGANAHLLSRISLDYNITSWNEYTPIGAYLSSTLSGELEFTYHLSPFMELTLSNNHVIYHDTTFTPLLTRLSLFFTWEVKPKSKVYIVVNKMYNKQNTWIENEHIYAFKIRYLFLI